MPSSVGRFETVAVYSDLNNLENAILEDLHMLDRNMSLKNFNKIKTFLSRSMIHHSFFELLVEQLKAYEVSSMWLQ